MSSKDSIDNLLESLLLERPEPAVTLMDIGIWSNRSLRAFLWGALTVDLGATIRRKKTIRIGWGRKASGRRAEVLAKTWSGRFCLLEDGFLRSYGFGENFPALSLVMDVEGIYYDSTRASNLESLLNDKTKKFDDTIEQVQLAKGMLISNRLSKYNQLSKYVNDYLRPHDSGRVLVIDQTVGDLSVKLGNASAHNFSLMLDTARKENPDAVIYIKTHPVVSSGSKFGYLTHIRDDESTVVIRVPINPLDLIEQMDRVYVVTSTMGFEALIAGKPVTCFGMPWYAGWGITDDRQKCIRRSSIRSLDDLFSAAYLHYTRYIDPETHKIGTIFDVMHWLVRQRKVMERLHGDFGEGRIIGVGFRRWKASNLSKMLTLDKNKLYWEKGLEGVRKLKPNSSDRLVFWGATPPKGLVDLAQQCGASLLRMEDGFVRSVGLGSDFIPPLSVVLDGRGIYFDPTQPSDLEVLLNDSTFTSEELAEARKIRKFMVAHGITKYNLERRCKPSWDTCDKRVVLVPGQVEDDASIILGAGSVTTNLGLLEAVRKSCPNDFIVYKPHPDVTSGNRTGDVLLQDALRWANHVETDCSVVSCLDACDEVHAMTSLAGFDALLRRKKVIVYGQPFYAGWGLTYDVLTIEQAPAFQRRQRALSLDELVAGVMLRYPIYWDPVLKGYTTCMAVLRQLQSERDRLEVNGGLEKLRRGWFHRKRLKVSTQLRAWLVDYK